MTAAWVQACFRHMVILIVLIRFIFNITHFTLLFSLIILSCHIILREKVSLHLKFLRVLLRYHLILLWNNFNIQRLRIRQQIKLLNNFHLFTLNFQLRIIFTFHKPEPRIQTLIIYSAWPNSLMQILILKKIVFLLLNPNEIGVNIQVLIRK